MDELTAPVLNFPAVFPDTGQAPDVEFPDINAYIRTRVQLKNEAGQSNAKQSNSVVPQTTTKGIQPGEVKDKQRRGQGHGAKDCHSCPKGC